MKRIVVTAEPVKQGSVVFDERNRKYTKRTVYSGPYSGEYWHTVDHALAFGWGALIAGTERLSVDPGESGRTFPPTLVELEHDSD